MKKRFFGILVGLLVMTFSLNSCADSSNGGSDDDDNKSDFSGSCTEVSISESVCVDYYDGYTIQIVQQQCSLSGDSYSSETCATTNPTYTKYPGKCKVTDSLYGISHISYYSGSFYPNISSANAHCSSYNLIAGFSSEWIAD